MFSFILSGIHFHLSFLKNEIFCEIFHFFNDFSIIHFSCSHFYQWLQVFTAVFTLECIMKIMALSKEFFINRWNVFDLVIVLASLLDLGLEIGSGLSVLRGMRLVSSAVLTMLLSVFSYIQVLDLNMYIFFCVTVLREWCSFLSPLIVAGAKTCSVMADDACSTQHHRINTWGPRKPYICPAHHYLYFRCYWNAALWQELYRCQLSSGSNPKVRWWMLLTSGMLVLVKNQKPFIQIISTPSSFWSRL